MDNKLSHFIFKDITNDGTLKNIYQQLLVDYANSLFKKSNLILDNNYHILLNYTDLLSLSQEQFHQNIAQQIVILLSLIFPENNEIRLVKESVYKNVSNLASLNLLKRKELLINGKYEFLRNLEVETHRIQNKIPDSNNSFFDSQKTVLENLNNNQYYSFSAPTSMGKTFVIMNFIRGKLKNNCSENFVIIVPTRALLSEIANNIIIEFKDYLGIGCHKIITNTASIQKDDKFVAVLTPERFYYSLLKQPEINFNYIFIDEAHKISDKDKRSVTYYKILEMLKGKPNSHIYFSSPVIPNPDVYLELTDFYTQSDNHSTGQAFNFSPVIQNKIYLDFNTKQYSIINNLTKEITLCNRFDSYFIDRMQALIYLGNKKCNLIYVSSANKAVEYAIRLSYLLNTQKNSQYSLDIQPELEEVAKQIEQKIHKDYYLAKLIRNQITKSTLAPDLEPYLLRHTFCTDCQAAGVPLNVAKELMGHSDISVTAKIYTHMVDEVFEQNRKRLAEYANQKEQKAVNI